MPRVPSRRRRRWRIPLAALGAALAAGAGLALLWSALPDPAGLAAHVPRTTALIEQRRAEARRARRPFAVAWRPVPLDGISPRLAEAVLASEDAGFFGHGAFDFRELRNAVGESVDRGRAVRGASTITQQLARNLYLGTERTLWRKLREAVLAVKLEQALPKRRILALYLNAVEWGEGVFGAEAAARARFGLDAAALTTAQAAVLAAMLPAPRRCDLASPSRWLRRRSRRVLDRLLDAGRLDPAEHAHASAELERLLAGPAPPRDEEEPPDEEELPAPAAATSRGSTPSAAAAAEAATSSPTEASSGAAAPSRAAPSGSPEPPSVSGGAPAETR